MGRSNLAASSSLSSASEKVVSKATADVALLSSISCHHVCSLRARMHVSPTVISRTIFSEETFLDYRICQRICRNCLPRLSSTCIPRQRYSLSRRCLGIRKRVRVHQLISRFLTKFKICLQKRKIIFDNLESSIG